MAKVVSVADVFIDTNILEFSAIKKHVCRPRKDTINWGGIEQEIMVHDMVTTNVPRTIKNETQKRDAILLGMPVFPGNSSFICTEKLTLKHGVCRAWQARLVVSSMVQSTRSPTQSRRSLA
ncbi:hypothetical protein [Thalassovita taeanensis]|uniref:hypothetical protein n=1 Tax=Thalassovita taeanensis TaxID=657014 RepID=UPI000B800142|nr:hypothetical protein [Thalassovita taeanensis]